MLKQTARSQAAIAGETRTRFPHLLSGLIERESPFALPVSRSHRQIPCAAATYLFWPFRCRRLLRSSHAVSENGKRGFLLSLPPTRISRVDLSGHSHDLGTGCFTRAVVEVCPCKSVAHEIASACRYNPL